MQMSAQKANIDAGMSDAQRQALQPIAHEICTKLDVENAQRPLKDRTPAERSALLVYVMQSTTTTNSTAIEGAFGPDAMTNAKQLESVGQKIGILMLGECPSYILAAGQDSIDQKAAALRAQPKPAPASTKKPAVKAKVKVTTTKRK